MIAESDDIEQQLRQLAARISVIAEAPGVSFIPTGRHVHETKDPTTGRGWTLSDEFSARLRGAGSSPRRLRELAEWCEREIRARTHTPPKPERKFKDSVLEDWEGFGYVEVGFTLGVAATTVFRWRVEDGRRGTDGVRC